MKISKMIFVLFFIFILTGCYDYVEINNLAVTVGVGIDITDDSNYKVTLQVINTKKETNGPVIFTYSSIGKTLDEAFRKATLDSPKNIYLNHIQIVVIGEELARMGINDILDFFYRKTEIIKGFYMIVASDTDAENILNNLPENTSVAKIKNSIITNSESLGISEEVNFVNLISTYISKKKEMSLPAVRINNSQVILSSIGVFKDDKLQGFLTDEESIALSFIKGLISKTAISYTCDNEKYVVAEVMYPEVNIEVVKNGPSIRINIKSNANIVEVTCSLDLQSSSVINDVEKNIGQEIERLINSSIKSINEKYNSDIFGFRDIFYKKNSEYYHSIQSDWYKNIFSNLNITVNSNITIKQKGSILGVINNE